MKEEALLAIGLTSNEAKVYLVLLKLASANVNEITKKSGVHRVNVYDILDRLTEKGLVSRIISNKKKVYQAANPEVLKEIIRKKEFQVVKALPELMSDYNINPQKEEVYYFHGPDGVYTAYMMMLAQNKTLYAIGGSGRTRTFLKHRHDKFAMEMKKRKAKVKALYYEFTRKTGVVKDFDVRYLPDKYQNPTMIDVCGSLVVILIATGEVSAIVIDNQVLADSYKKYFDLLWSTVAEV
jgi:predicted transcriptional regulator